MNCTACEALLSAYIDHDLEREERSRVDAHLRACGPCRVALSDLDAIRAAAGSLEPLVPPAHVWHRVADAASRQRPVRNTWLTWRPAAALAMTAVLSVGLWRVATLLEPAGAPGVTRGAFATAEAADPEAAYALAIARLEEAAAVDRDALDPDTATAIDTGLMAIDEAIVESRAALRSEPGSELAQEILVQALGRKVALLQDRLALMSEWQVDGGAGGGRSPVELNQ